MTIEQSHGKARPTLPRASDLRPVETRRDPSEGRAAGGRFAPGNRISVGAGEKNAVRRLLGRAAADGDVAAIARDGVRLLAGALRDLPHDGPVVRQLAALYARHAALQGFYSARADEKGIDSDDGIRFADLALKHGQRAERLAVTMLDVATKLATKAGDCDAALDVDAANREAEAATRARREHERRALDVSSDEGESS